MPFLQQGQDATVTIPATQSIRIGSLKAAITNVTIPDGLRGSPITTVVDTSQTIGPFPAGATVSVAATKGVIEYVVGASPVLTDVTYNPAAVAITGGTMAAVAVTTGSINNTPIGGTTRSTLAATTIASTATDSTGTPGNVTNNSANGRAAFAAAGTAVVVTNSSVAAADTVQVTLLGAADTTLTAIVGVTVAAGSFTVTGNAAATATKGFMFTVIKA
jgi:hypothetical protein